MRERLRRSQRPERVFEVAGVCDADLAARLRAVLTSGDGYASTGKPVIDWDDEGAREALVDSRARDSYAILEALDAAQRTRAGR
jgi:hypothetical protein